MKRLACHRKHRFKSAGADRQHTDGSGGWRVAIGAKQRLAGLPESLLVYWMASRSFNRGERDRVDSAALGLAIQLDEYAPLQT
jgi:hypothetical protein